jgi:acetyltransferase-like isoleucine patch superfamily enzyme
MLINIFALLFHFAKFLGEKTYFRQGAVLASVVVADDARIRARAIILPGVVISKRCTSAAGAVVTGVRAVQIYSKRTTRRAAFL